MGEDDDRGAGAAAAQIVVEPFKLLRPEITSPPASRFSTLTSATKCTPPWSKLYHPRHRSSWSTAASCNPCMTQGFKRLADDGSAWCSERRALAALVYEHNNHPINLFVWPGAGDRDGNPSGYNLIHWIQDGMAISVVSDFGKVELGECVQLWRGFLRRRWAKGDERWRWREAALGRALTNRGERIAVAGPIGLILFQVGHCWTVSMQISTRISAALLKASPGNSTRA